MARSVLRREEWPTWVALAGCYVAWLASTWGLGRAEGWEIVPLGLVAIVATGFHASLQHEALHGHPTGSSALNEALVFPALGLIYPYRRFRELHIRHHDNERLTDPYDDPETWYLAEAEAERLSAPMRLALEVNRTLLGRMLIGPLLGTWGLLRNDWPGLMRGERRLIDAWARHLVGCALALGWAWGVCGLNPLVYLCAVALPGAALIYVRTYIEHRADADWRRRSAVVAGGAFWRLLFLNNNFHALHHEEPALPWFRLPARWAARRAEVEAGETGYLVPGYGSVFRRFLLSAREPVAHPLLRRRDPAA